MSWLSSLFSSKEIVKDGMDALGKGIDAAFLTKEESTGFFLKYLEISMPMNVARRALAFAITFMWVLEGIICTICILTGYKVDDMVGFASVYVMPSFTVLVGFYFWKRIKGEKTSNVDLLAEYRKTLGQER